VDVGEVVVSLLALLLTKQSREAYMLFYQRRGTRGRPDLERVLDERRLAPPPPLPDATAHISQQPSTFSNSLTNSTYHMPHFDLDGMDDEIMEPGVLRVPTPALTEPPTNNVFLGDGNWDPKYSPTVSENDMELDAASTSKMGFNDPGGPV